MSRKSSLPGDAPPVAPGSLHGSPQAVRPRSPGLSAAAVLQVARSPDDDSASSSERSSVAQAGDSLPCSPGPADLAVEVSP